MYDTSIIMQFGTRFRRLTPEPCDKFHDDNLKTLEVINKRDFKINERKFLSNSNPWLGVIILGLHAVQKGQP